MTRSQEYIVQVRKVDLRTDVLTGKPLTYSYGSPLRAGDRVVCPANPYSEAYVREVVGLGSDYEGLVKPLLCRAAPDRRRP
jgi:hypothetical protein